MPIVLSRSGEVLEAPVLTQEQKNMAWEKLTIDWARAHPEVFKQMKENLSAERPCFPTPLSRGA